MNRNYIPINHSLFETNQSFKRNIYPLLEHLLCWLYIYGLLPIGYNNLCHEEFSQMWFSVAKHDY